MSRDWMICTCVAMASWSAAARSIDFSASGRRNTFSRPSTMILASDLYFGVIVLTTTSVAAATRSVGIRISHFLRHSATPSARRSSSLSVSIGRNADATTALTDCITDSATTNGAISSHYGYCRVNPAKDAANKRKVVGGQTESAVIADVNAA